MGSKNELSTLMFFVFVCLLQISSWRPISIGELRQERFYFNPKALEICLFLNSAFWIEKNSPQNESMEKYQRLLNNIRRHVSLSPEEEERLVSIIRISRVKKRQFIVQPGFVCQHRNYIERGAFRLYYLDQDGKEHTVSIGVEDWFVSDFYSYITQTPATLYVEALEDSTIFQCYVIFQF